MSGVRSSKTVNGTIYNFTTLSGLVMQQTCEDETLYFIYDDSSQPYALISYKQGDGSENPDISVYYYALNLQGDVVALLYSDGTAAAYYEYDPWGKVTVKDPTYSVNTSAAYIGNINPLRYRGYYFDTETGLYYLQSRYYDPAIGRFINADTFATTDAEGLLSTNMFAYCENNPVMRSDPNGELPIFIVGALIGVGEQFVCDIIANVAMGRPLDKLSSTGAYISAAINGAFSTLPGGKFVTTFAREIITETVGFGVDVLVSPDSIKKARVGSDFLSSVADNSLRKNASSIAEKIGKIYKGNNKTVKAGIKIAQKATRILFNHSPRIIRIIGSFFK